MRSALVTNATGYAGPTDIMAAVLGQVETLDALVSNDMHPARAHVPDTAPLEDLRGNLGRQVEFPYALIR